MALTVSFINPNRTGTTLAFSVERVSDTNFYDTSDSTFKAKGLISGNNFRNTLTEGSTWHIGSWTGSISSTPVAQFTDGRYRIRIHDTSASDKVVAGGETLFQNGDQVDLDVDPLDAVGFDSVLTVHDKLDALKTQVAGVVNTSAVLSVAPGEFIIVTDIENIGVSTPNSLDIAVRREHKKIVSFTVKDTSNTAINLSNTKIRIVVQDARGQLQTVRLDYNSVDNPTKVDVYSPTTGKFRWTISNVDSDISEIGGDGNGRYALEILWDRLLSGEYELLVGGLYIVETGSDLLPG